MLTLYHAPFSRSTRIVALIHDLGLQDRVQIEPVTVTRPDGSGGQIIGDELAAKEAARAVRLARNILMASQYTYLDMRGLVARRWVESRAFQQPQLGEQSVQKIVGARLALGVKYLELAPQYQGQLLEQVGIDLLRASDGRVLAQLEYDYTT